MFCRFPPFPNLIYKYKFIYLTKHYINKLYLIRKSVENEGLNNNRKNSSVHKRLAYVYVVALTRFYGVNADYVLASVELDHKVLSETLAHILLKDYDKRML